MGNCATGNNNKIAAGDDEAELLRKEIALEDWKVSWTVEEDGFTIEKQPKPVEDEEHLVLDKYDHTKDCYELPKGGYVVKTSEGPIQIGMPPETIKDHLKVGNEVPTAYVVYGEMFDRVNGMNVAEFEFPTYFNFFIKRKQIKLLTTLVVEKRILRVFRETLLGPKTYKIQDDFASDTKKGAFPNFKAEGEALDNFRKDMTVQKMVSFEPFTAKGKDEAAIDFGNAEEDADRAVRICVKQMMNGFRNDEPKTGGFHIVEEDDKYFEITDKKHPKGPDYVIRVPCKPVLKMEHHARDYKPFDIPVFGVTMLGVSHGFDAKGKTTGFVLWINRKGIMVDPPFNSSRILEEMGIPPRTIDGIILSHCHADHDAGAFQKILRQRKVKLYTSKTIRDSFMRKYAALTGFTTEFLENLFEAVPVKVGTPLEITNKDGDVMGTITFNYSLHVIPTVGFVAECQGKSICYSADTRTSPEFVEKMFEDDVIGEERYNELHEFPVSFKKHAIVLHEMGVPPIHTPKEMLAELPEEVKQRLFVVHAAKSALNPETDGLKSLDRCDTVRIHLPKKDGAEEGEGGPSGEAAAAVVQQGSTAQIMNVLDQVAWIGKALSDYELGEHDLPYYLQELSKNFKRQKYEPGEVVVKEGSRMTRLIIVFAGVAMKKNSKGKEQKIPCHGMIGERGLLQKTGKSTKEELHKNEVVARSPLYTVEISVTQFAEWCTREIEVGDIMLEALDEQEKKKDAEVWKTVEKNETLSAILDQQECLDDFIQICTKITFRKEDFVYPPLAPSQDSTSGNGRPARKSMPNIPKRMYLIEHGEVACSLDCGVNTFRGTLKAYQMPPKLSDGAFFGDINSIIKDDDTILEVTVESDVLSAYAIEREDWLEFLEHYPGIMFQMLDRYHIWEGP